MTPKRMIAEISKHEARIAKDRDKIDEFIGHLEQLSDNCCAALDSLRDARDALSELV